MQEPQKKQRTEIAQQTAEMFDVTAAYVRLVIRDKGCAKYKSEKANAIRTAYQLLQRGRNNLLRAVADTVKI